MKTKFSRIESTGTTRIIRNRESARRSLEKKRQHLESLEKKNLDLTAENHKLKSRLEVYETMYKAYVLEKVCSNSLESANNESQYLSDNQSFDVKNDQITSSVVQNALISIVPSM